MSTGPAEVAFEATGPCAFLDYFRVPYRVVGVEGPRPAPVLRDAGALWPVPATGAHLSWSRPDGRPGHECVTGCFTVGRMRLAGTVLRDDVVARELGAGRGTWYPAEPLQDTRGTRVASVWRDRRDGSVLLPFDPGQVMTTLWSERYRRGSGFAARARAERLLVRGYYRVRPVLPRGLQLALRRAFSRAQGRAEFPRWPIEDGLSDLYEWLFALLGALGGGPVPWLGLWPDGREWALVLTHDVETAAGLRRREALRAPERELGLRSSWNLVAERYDVGDDVVAALRDEGCEIGVHGLRHDGRDLGSRRQLRRRLPAMRRAADRWGAVGFRSPATQRVWEWMPGLGFDYDSSTPDTDPFEPQPGGCATVLPFFNDDLVELPITLPQDHTLFCVLDHQDGGLWLDKARHIRHRGGMALALTHPDYVADGRVERAYRALLAEFAADPTVWHALPREVAGWWRERAASGLRRSGAGWEVIGPAAARGRARFGGATNGFGGPTNGLGDTENGFDDTANAMLSRPMTTRTPGRPCAPSRPRPATS